METARKFDGGAGFRLVLISENVPEFVSDVHAWKPVPPLNAANEVEANSLGVQNVHRSASPRARITTRVVTMGCWESFGSRPVWCTVITAACYEYSGIGALVRKLGHA